MEQYLKQIATHTMAVVIGLFLAASCVKNSGPTIITKEVIKEVKVEVPVDVVKEKVVTKVVERIRYILTPEEPVYVVQVINRYDIVERNKLYLIAGYGINSFKTRSGPGFVEVSEDYGLVMGFGYERRLNEFISVGGQYLFNNTVLGTLGVHF